MDLHHLLACAEKPSRLANYLPMAFGLKAIIDWLQHIQNRHHILRQTSTQPLAADVEEELGQLRLLLRR